MDVVVVVVVGGGMLVLRERMVCVGLAPRDVKPPKERLVAEAEMGFFHPAHCNRKESFEVCGARDLHPGYRGLGEKRCATTRAPDST